MYRTASGTATWPWTTDRVLSRLSFLTLREQALRGVILPNTGGIGLQATLLVTKTLLIASEGWGGAPTIRAYDKKTGAIVGEVKIPGQMGSIPMTYTVNGKQYIAFTVGTPTQPAELVALALGK
jgi:hypothetical protein